MKTYTFTLLKILFFFQILIHSTSFAQNTGNKIDVTAVSIIDYGDFSISIFKSINSSNRFFKSSAHRNGLVKLNDKFNLELNNGTNNSSFNVFQENNSPLYIKAFEISLKDQFDFSKVETPLIIDGILFFKNRQHFEDVDLLIQDYINQDSPDSLDSESKLIIIENSLVGFTSYRNHLNEKFDLTDEGLTDNELDEYLKLNFINDLVWNTLFNEHKLIGIGDSIFYYNKIDNMISFDKKDKPILRLLMNHTIESFDDDELGLFFAENNDKVNILSSTIDLISDETKSSVVYVDNPFIKILDRTVFELYHVADCNPFKKGLTIKVFRDSSYFTPLDPVTNTGCNCWTKKTREVFKGVSFDYLKINWGDGTPIETINNYKTGIVYYHNYQNFGVYNPTTSLKINGNYWNDGAGIAGGTELLFNCLNVCTSNEKNKEGRASSSNYKMECSLSSKALIGKKISASTTAYRKSNGKWKKDKANTIFVWFTAIGYNDNCEFAQDLYDNKLKHKDKSIQVSKHRMFNKYRIYTGGTGEIRSIHSIDEGSNHFNVNLTLNLCE